MRNLPVVVGGAHLAVALAADPLLHLVRGHNEPVQLLHLAHSGRVERLGGAGPVWLQLDHHLLLPRVARGQLRPAVVDAAVVGVVVLALV